MKTLFKKITGLFALGFMWLAMTAGAVAEGPKEPLSGGIYVDFKKNFSIDFPEGWLVGHGENTQGEGFVFFSKPNDIIHGLYILPEGEFDFGLPPSEPLEKWILLDGREALKQEWKTEGGKLIFITMKENYPDSWNERNRIQIKVDNKKG